MMMKKGKGSRHQREDMVATASSAMICCYSQSHHAPSVTFCAHNQSTTAAAKSPILISRRKSLSLVILTACCTGGLEARAKDIPLFGLRKKLEKVEQEAEEIVKEGVESAERGIEESVEVIKIAEDEVLVGGGGLGQAGAVLAAEAVGVLVATSVVNGILGPES